MKLSELRKKFKEFTINPTQTGLFVLRSEIKESYIKGDIQEKTKDNLLKELYGISTMAGLFILKANMEAKEAKEVEEEEEDEEESYEDSYSYEESYDEN